MTLENTFGVPWSLLTTPSTARMFVPENDPAMFGVLGPVTAAGGVLIRLILDAGNGAEQRDHLAAPGRQIRKLVRREDGRVLGAIGLHLRGLSGDADRFRDVADLQDDVAGGHALVGAHHESAAAVDLESVLFHTKVVGLGLHGVEGEGADFIRDGAAGFAASGAGQRDLGIRDRLAPTDRRQLPEMVPVTVIWAVKSPQKSAVNSRHRSFMDTEITSRN